jgi:hypothetical protein
LTWFTNFVYYLIYEPNEFTKIEWISAPFKYIYFNGPSKMGFWNGKDMEDACSELTRIPATVWHHQREACEALLAKDFRAFCIGSFLIVGAVSAWKALDYCTLKLVLNSKSIKCG